MTCGDLGELHRNPIYKSQCGPTMLPSPDASVQAAPTEPARVDAYFPNEYVSAKATAAGSVCSRALTNSRTRRAPEALEQNARMLLLSMMQSDMRCSVLEAASIVSPFLRDL